MKKCAAPVEIIYNCQMVFAIADLRSMPSSWSADHGASLFAKLGLSFPGRISRANPFKPYPRDSHFIISKSRSIWNSSSILDLATSESRFIFCVVGLICLLPPTDVPSIAVTSIYESRPATISTLQHPKNNSENCQNLTMASANGVLSPPPQPAFADPSIIPAIKRKRDESHEQEDHVNGVHSNQDRPPVAQADQEFIRDLIDVLKS